MTAATAVTAAPAVPTPEGGAAGPPANTAAMSAGAGAGAASRPAGRRARTLRWTEASAPTTGRGDADAQERRGSVAVHRRNRVAASDAAVGGINATAVPVASTSRSACPRQSSR